MRAVPVAVFLMLAVGFAVIAATPYLGAPRATQAAPDRAPSGPEAARLDLPAPSRTDFTPFLERPLFSAVRRPPPPEAPGAPLVDPGEGLVLGLYEIAGVVMGAGGPVAMLRDAEGRMIRIRVGDRIDGRIDGRVDGRTGEAEVAAISLDALTFRQGGDTVVAPVRGDEPDGGGRPEGTTTE